MTPRLCSHVLRPLNQHRPLRASLLGKRELCLSPRSRRAELCKHTILKMLQTRKQQTTEQRSTRTNREEAKIALKGNYPSYFWKTASPLCSGMEGTGRVCLAAGGRRWTREGAGDQTKLSCRSGTSSSKGHLLSHVQPATAAPSQRAAAIKAAAERTACLCQVQPLEPRHEENR